MDSRSSKQQASEDIVAWYQSLKATGGFGPIHQDMLRNGRLIFESDRVSDPETLATIRSCYQETKYILDPHSAVGVTAAKRSISRTSAPTHHISLSTAHPAKFSDSVTSALKNEAGFNFEAQVLPDELKALLQKETRVTTVDNSFLAVKEIIKSQVQEDVKAEDRDS
jgi:threonine synthase